MKEEIPDSAPVEEAPKEEILEEPVVEEELGEPAPMMSKNKSAVVQQWEDEMKADQEEEAAEEEEKERAMALKKQQTKKEVEDWQHALENEPQSVMQTEQSEIESKVEGDLQIDPEAAKAELVAAPESNTSAVAREAASQEYVDGLLESAAKTPEDAPAATTTEAEKPE